MIEILKSAIVATAAGKLDERQLIAITLAVNSELPATVSDPASRAVLAAFVKQANAALAERVVELDRGDA